MIPVIARWTTISLHHQHANQNIIIHCSTFVMILVAEPKRMLFFPLSTHSLTRTPVWKSHKLSDFNVPEDIDCSFTFFFALHTSWGAAAAPVSPEADDSGVQVFAASSRFFFFFFFFATPSSFFVSVHFSGLLPSLNYRTIQKLQCALHSSSLAALSLALVRPMLPRWKTSNFRDYSSLLNTRTTRTTSAENRSEAIFHFPCSPQSEKI